MVEPALFFEAWFNMSYSKSILLFLGFTSLSVITGSGAEVSGEKEVLTRARTAFQNGKLAEALGLADKLIETEPGYRRDSVAKSLKKLAPLCWRMIN